MVGIQHTVYHMTNCYYYSLYYYSLDIVNIINMDVYHDVYNIYI